MLPAPNPSTKYRAPTSLVEQSSAPNCTPATHSPMKVPPSLFAKTMERAVEVRLGSRRGAEPVAGESGVLRRDAGVEHADDHAGPGVIDATDGLPDAAGSLQSEELRRRHRGDVLELIDGERRDVLVRGQLRCLRGGQVGREPVEGEGVRIVDVGSDGVGNLFLLLLQVRGVLLDRAAARLELLALLRLSRCEAVDTAFVGGGGRFDERDDVAARLERKLAVAPNLGRGGGGGERGSGDDAGCDQGGRRASGDSAANGHRCIPSAVNRVGVAEQGRCCAAAGGTASESHTRGCLPPLGGSSTFLFSGAISTHP